MQHCQKYGERGVLEVAHLFFFLNKLISMIRTLSFICQHRHSLDILSGKTHMKCLINYCLLHVATLFHKTLQNHVAKKVNVLTNAEPY